MGFIALFSAAGAYLLPPTLCSAEHKVDRKAGRMWNSGGKLRCGMGIRPPQVSTIPRPYPCTTRHISARIPHQSQIGSEGPICASFSPGEAMAASPQRSDKRKFEFYIYNRKGFTIAFLYAMMYVVEDGNYAIFFTETFHFRGKIPQDILFYGGNLSNGKKSSVCRDCAA